MTDTRDLVVLSHLRWTWVWQRPQHLISRLARDRAESGARTFFVEEPLAIPGVTEPVVRSQQHGAVIQLWLEVPGTDEVEYLAFDDPRAASYGILLADAVDAADGVDVWLYTPMASDLADALEPSLLIYDVMDDLANFADAPSGLLDRQRRVLAEADVVFTGGRSLDRSVSPARTTGETYCFPSGVDAAHYAQSRALRGGHARPVAGYVGVIDERLDLGLIARLAADLPDWDIHMAGPVTKIDPASLPDAPNIKWLGMQKYEDLPAVMANFDVALMPFALNDATKNISPTKTLEYLAAGLPVVSTRVADVVSDFGHAVHLIDVPQELADACRHVATHSVERRDEISASVRRRHEWDVIAGAMASLIDDADRELQLALTHATA